MLRGNTGTARKALVADLYADADWTPETTRDDTTGDFVNRDDIDYPAANAVPMWLLGMGW